MFIGLCGYFVELYFYGIETLLLGPLFIIIITDVNQTLHQVVDYLLKSSSLIMICMMAICVTSFLWFTISQKISAIEQAEAEILLAE